MGAAGAQQLSSMNPLEPLRGQRPCSASTAHGSTAHTFNLTGGSGSGPGMKVATVRCYSAAEQWQKRARRRGPGHIPARGGSGAPPGGPWLARETPAGCPRQASPAWAIALLGGAPAGSGPGTSPCIDGLSLVSGMVVPQHPAGSNHTHDGRWAWRTCCGNDLARTGSTLTYYTMGRWPPRSCVGQGGQWRAQEVGGHVQLDQAGVRPALAPASLGY